MTDGIPTERITEVDVWLEAGRDGRAFSYCDGHQLGIGLGDLVRVSLRGRPLQGLVVACREREVAALDPKLQPVEALIQSAAVDPSWRSWLDAMARRCHTSPFRMLKAALPPGWLGQRPRAPARERLMWWVESSAEPTAGLPKRQQALLNQLQTSGGQWQLSLIHI